MSQTETTRSDAERLAVACLAHAQSPQVTDSLLRALSTSGADAKVEFAVPPTPAVVRELSGRHGRFLAEHLTDPELLTVLAGTSKAPVRELALNPATPQAAIDGLWHEALRNPDLPLPLLASRVSDADLNAAFPELAQHRPSLWSETDWFYLCIERVDTDLLIAALPHCPRPGSPVTEDQPLAETMETLLYSRHCHRPLTASQVAAVLRAPSTPPSLAVRAVVFCAGGRVPGLSFTDAAALLEAGHSPDGSGNTAPAAVERALLDRDVPIDMELAQLAADHVSFLEASPKFAGVRMFDEPLFGTRMTADAGRFLCSSEHELLRRHAVLAATPETVSALLGSPDLEPPSGAWIAFQLLQAADAQLTADQYQQAVRVCVENRRPLSLRVPARYPLYPLDEDSLVWCCTSGSTTYDVAEFLTSGVPLLSSMRVSEQTLSFLRTGCPLLTGRGPDFFARLLAEESSSTSSDCREQVANQMFWWEDKPWADALIEALGPGLLACRHSRTQECLARRFDAAFGDVQSMWLSAFDLMAAGFPGSLTDLVGIVRSMHGSMHGSMQY